MSCRPATLALPLILSLGAGVAFAAGGTSAPGFGAGSVESAGASGAAGGSAREASSRTASETTSPRPAPAVDYAAAWPPLIEAREFAKARQLCEQWLGAHETAALAEAHKCLANVEAADARVRKPELEAPGREIPTPRYEGTGVERALAHVNQAIALAPNDLSVHLGRMTLLIRSSRFEEVPAAMEESLALYKGPDALDQWLQVCGALYGTEQFEVVLAMYQALEKRYPASHEVIEDIGMTLVHLDRRDEALPYLVRAVDLAPDDPIDNRNLADAYVVAGDNDGAEVHLRKAISVTTDEEMRKAWMCDLGEFLEMKRMDRLTGCEMETAHCPPERRTACAPLGAESVPACLGSPGPYVPAEGAP